MWPNSVSVLISSVAPAQTEHSCKPDLSNQLYVMAHVIMGMWGMGRGMWGKVLWVWGYIKTLTMTFYSSLRLTWHDFHAQLVESLQLLNLNRTPIYVLCNAA